MKIEVTTVEELAALLYGVSYDRLLVTVKTMSKETEAILKSKKEADRERHLRHRDSRLLFLAAAGITAEPRGNEPREVIPLRELYRDYVEFCKAHNWNCFGSGEFSRRLLVEDFSSVRRSTGMHYYIYRGEPYSVDVQPEAEKVSDGSENNPE